MNENIIAHYTVILSYERQKATIISNAKTQNNKDVLSLQNLNNNLIVAKAKLEKNLANTITKNSFEK